MRRATLIGTAVVLVAIAGGFAYKWTQRGPGRVSTSSAIARLHTSSTVEPEPGQLQPHAGVYIYAGSGKEHLTFLNTSQAQGPTQPGTVVTKPNGCWTFTMEFNSYHRQSWERCAREGRLYEYGGTTDQRFDFVAFSQHEHNTSTCEPPKIVADVHAAPGTTWPVHCTGESQTTKSHLTQTGTVTYIGEQELLVGSTPVMTLHTRGQLSLSGDQTGTETRDIWFAKSDGLPVQEHHSLKVVSTAPAPINHVTYTENGSWFLTSLAPRT